MDGEANIWVPSEAERNEAAEGYITYLIGAGILLNPGAKSSLDAHGRRVDEPYREEIALTAEGLM